MNSLVKFFSRRRTWSLPYVIFLTIFVVVPLILIMVYAFQSKDGGFSLENFQRFINQPEAANTFIYSIGIALITTIICIILGYPAAYILSRINSSTARIVVMLFIVSNSAMAKVDIVGINTIIMPLTTPGIESGNTTRVNT